MGDPDGISGALGWAARLAGAPGTLEADEAVPRVLLAWDEIARASLERRRGGMSPSFFTLEFSRRERHWNGQFEALEPALERLRSGETTLEQAMSQVSHTFKGDPARLLAWRELGANLAAVAGWMDGFEQKRDYLAAALPSPDAPLEERRRDLIDRTGRPHAFIDAGLRERFDQDFADYQRAYAAAYCAQHDDAVVPRGGASPAEARIDPVAVRNLELLSRLRHVDRGYAARTRALVRAVRASRCAYPAHAILARQPRCYCNFNPTGPVPIHPAARLMRAIDAGIAYFRALLRRLERPIIQELKRLEVDDACARQIAALLSRGPMIPLDPWSIQILDTILGAHAEELRVEVRSIRH